MLTARSLNRTLLRRQHLLERTSMPAPALVEHVVGLQAQDPLPPYVGLWARLEGFDPAELSGLLESREVSRITLMRGTIHLVNAPDCLGLRPLLQATLERQARSTPFFQHCAHIPRGNAVFVDGMLEGHWHRADDGRVVVEPFRRLTRAERAELETEVAALEVLLSC